MTRKSRNHNKEGECTEESTQPPNHYQEREDSEESTKPTCKVCFDDENGDDNRLLSGICPCKGSSTFIHHGCLIKCFESSGNQSCPCCKFEVKTGMKWKPWRMWSWEPMTDVDLIPLVSVLIETFLVVFSVLIISLVEYTTNNIERRSLFEIYMDLFVIQCCALFFLGFMLRIKLDVIEMSGIIPHCRKFCNRNQERGAILPYEDNDE